MLFIQCMIKWWPLCSPFFSPTSVGFPTFKVDGVDEEIFMFPDPPHILKNQRNALFNHGKFTIPDELVKEHCLPSNTVEFKFIKKLVELQEEKQLKIAPHLSSDDINIGRFNKMKVKPAMHVFSRETAEAIKFAASHYPDIFPQEAMTTAFFCDMIGQYYDHMTCRNLGLALSLKQPEKLQEAFTKMQGFMNFYSSLFIGKSHRGGLLPTQRGVLMSTISMIQLTNFMLSQKGIKYFRPGLVSNDPIENFHSCVRARNAKPTCLNFMRIVKGICMVQCLDGSVHGSYERDDENASVLHDLKALKAEKAAREAEDVVNLDQVMTENDAADGVIAEDEEFINMLYPKLDIDDQVDIEDISEINGLAYLSGYMLRSTICNQSKCDECQKAFVAAETDDQSCNELIRLREYKKGALCKPTKLANDMLQLAEKVFRCEQERLKWQKKVRLADKITSKLELHWRSSFPMVPKCHIKTIAARFAKIRLQFFGAFTSRQLVIKQKKKLKGQSNASKSTVPLFAPNMQ